MIGESGSLAASGHLYVPFFEFVTALPCMYLLLLFSQ